ncbi:FAD-binding oxidoreductase [Maricurvus nonylphenolicus]|uniref:FAD-binding oxidoreductase n=1 Tax=Maricurvus nonylphenolicus TaxID=1008307 RepID=UPI0036F323EF
MKLINRRSLLKGLGLGGLLGVFPSVYAESNNSDSDVLYLQRNNRLFDDFTYLFNKRISLTPKVIAVCSNEQGVQKAVRYAKEQDLPVTVKSGGHSFEGFSLNNGGMVIDVSTMAGLELNERHELIAQPAVRLAQLYGFSLARGRLLPTGSCGTVGLSGITLGGGYGLFSRQFGLTCDYLTGVRMVDAEGNVIDTDLDADKGAELLWACRGGGNGNFGVVTQLRYNTVAAPETLHQHRFRSYKLNPARASRLAEFWFEQCKNLPHHAYSAFVLNGSTLTVMFTATEHDSAMETLLANFDSTMDNNAGLKPDPLAVGLQYYYGRSDALYFKNISAGYYKGFEDIRGCTEALFTEVINTPGMVFQISSLGGEINNLKRSNGSTADGAYVHRQANFLGEAQCYWQSPKQEARSMQGMATLQTILYENGVRQHYINYPDMNIRDYERAYYGESYPRLQKLKRELDPGNRFSYPQGIKL